MAYVCTLYHASTQGWKVFQDAVTVEVTESGFICRRLATQQMIVDCPKLTIDKIEETQQDECFRLASQGKAVLALKLSNRAHAAHLKERIKATGYNLVPFSELTSMQSHGHGFPDLSKKIVRDYILELLFSQEFHEFVDDVEGLMGLWRHKLNFN